MTKAKTKQNVHVILTVTEYESLRALAFERRVPMADLVRAGVRLVLARSLAKQASK